MICGLAAISEASVTSYCFAMPHRVSPFRTVYGPRENAVYLKKDGTVELRGTKIAIEGYLTINGVPYKPCTCGEMEA